MSTKTSSVIIIAIAFAGLVAISAFALIRLPPAKTLVGKMNQIRLEGIHLSSDSRVPPVLAPISTNRINGALDIQVIVDTGVYTYDGVAAQSDVDMTDADIEATIQYSGQLFQQKTGIPLHLRGIDRRPLSAVDYGSLWGWARSYIETTPNPPEAFVIFSIRHPSWMNGGFAQLSETASVASGYCNEFVLNQALLPMAQQTPDEQRKAAIAIVDWGHKFGSCGYGDQFPRRTRVSERPVRGECRNNSSDTCLIQNASYYQCASLVNDRSAKPLFFRASSIVHELMHTLDLNQYGHIGEVECNAAMRGDATYMPSDSEYNEEWFSMCPRAFTDVRTAMRRCS